MKTAFCPICGGPGQCVKLLTVRSLLRAEVADKVADVDYLFCSTPDCSVVYFSLSANVIIEKCELTTRVGLKETASPRPLCYCFHYSIEDVENEIRQTSKSTIGNDVAEKIRAGLCHCEDANPEGRCCLGRVKDAIEHGFRIFQPSNIL